jgi:uncharacterized protein YlzI (FlbEa/FlbD family)
MRFLEFTLRKGTPVSVNIDTIEYFKPSRDNKDHTVLLMNRNSLIVNETYESVINRIQKLIQ